MPMYCCTLKLQPGVSPLLTKLGLDILVESRGTEDVLGRWGNVVSRVEDRAGIFPVASEAPQSSGQPQKLSEHHHREQARVLGLAGFPSSVPTAPDLQ